MYNYCATSESKVSFNKMSLKPNLKRSCCISGKVCSSCKYSKDFSQKNGCSPTDQTEKTFIEENYQIVISCPILKFLIYSNASKYNVLSEKLEYKFDKIFKSLVLYLMSIEQHILNQLLLEMVKKIQIFLKTY